MMQHHDAGVPVSWCWWHHCTVGGYDPPGSIVPPPYGCVGTCMPAQRIFILVFRRPEIFQTCLILGGGLWAVLVGGKRVERL